MLFRHSETFEILRGAITAHENRFVGRNHLVGGTSDCSSAIFYLGRDGNGDGDCGAGRSSGFGKTDSSGPGEGLEGRGGLGGIGSLLGFGVGLSVVDLVTINFPFSFEK